MLRQLAVAADTVVAKMLKIDQGGAVFMVERSTWNQDRSITLVRLTFAPGYRMHTTL